MATSNARFFSLPVYCTFTSTYRFEHWKY